jgi:hypothetical protein
MKWGHWREHTDFLRTVLNTIILVSGAAGSIINLVKGNNIPVVLSIAAMVIVVVFILAELKERRDRKREAEKVVAGVSFAQAQVAATPVPYPTVVPESHTLVGNCTYWNSGGRLVLRLVAPRASGGKP